MLTTEQRAAIVAWCKGMVRKASGMHWLFDQRSLIAQAAHAVLPHDAAVSFSWRTAEINDIWKEIVYG